MDMCPPATDMDMLLLAMDMLLPELPMVDMLLLAIGMDMLLLATRYGYASTRTSYGGYASSSYRYRYVLIRTSYGGHTPSPQAQVCLGGGGQNSPLNNNFS